MARNQQLVPTTHISPKIIEIRGCRVMVDSDLAAIYGVSTKVFNQAVKRNSERFPEDFAFRLTEREKREVVTNCDHLQRLKFSPGLPLVFTEHGAIMAANMLRSAQAVRMSIEVVRAFTRLRQLAISHHDLAQRLKKFERKYDKQFRVVFDALRELFDVDEGESNKPPIGFQSEIEASKSKG